MLVLGCKENEGITIINEDTDERLVLIVTSVKKGTEAKLGFDCPKNYRIYRDKVLAQKGEQRGKF